MRPPRAGAPAVASAGLMLARRGPRRRHQGVAPWAHSLSRSTRGRWPGVVLPYTAKGRGSAAAGLPDRPAWDRTAKVSRGSDHGILLSAAMPDGVWFIACELRGGWYYNCMLLGGRLIGRLRAGVWFLSCAIYGWSYHGMLHIDWLIVWSLADVWFLSGVIHNVAFAFSRQQGRTPHGPR